MVAHRSGTRSVTVERPRQKGWWGAPDEDEIEDDSLDLEVPQPARDTVRRPAAPRTPRPVTQVGRALTIGQIEAIRVVMRLFVEDDTTRGVDPRSTLVCHRCAAPRPAIGSVRYDRFTFCNDCSIDYEIARARGLVDTPVDFIERSAARAASA